MTDMSRRDAVALLGALPLAAALRWSPSAAERAGFLERLEAAGTRFEPGFFTPAEWETVRVLADLVIPRDERSGSATDAKVPEFMDFMMQERKDEQLWMRGGLAWLDAESERRFGRRFTTATDTERRAVLDDIAWPARAKPGLSQGVSFFTAFRDLTASGFWSSEIGIKDLEYRGNTVVPEWSGCPPEALAKLGVTYDGGR